MTGRIAAGRAFRRQVITDWGSPGSPAPQRLYGKGRLMQHFAVDRPSLQGLCGADLTAVSDRPFESPARIQCPLCVSVVARVMARAVVQEAASKRIR